MRNRRKNEDRISHLPEEVLSHILSLMPTKFAVQSCILSKRWRNTWTLVTNLDFGDYHLGYGLDWLSNFIDQVLKRCKTSQVKLFRLGLFRYLVPKSHVSKWIDETVKLNVYELDIGVRLLELPLSMFTCKTLTKLSLFTTDDDSDVFNAPLLVILPRLKTLDINVNSLPSVNAFRLIRGCPVLENLSLVISLPENEDYNFNIPTLKRLELSINNYKDIKKVVLNVPNLEYLKVGGCLTSLFVMENLSSLVEATISFQDGSSMYLFAEFLKGISGVKSLLWSVQIDDVQKDIPLPKFPNMKHLDLKAFIPFRWPLVFQLLESCSELEHLCVEQVGKSSWIEPESVPTCILSNLRTMKIKDFMGWVCDYKVLEYMLGNADVLETLTITCNSLSMKEELRLCAWLLKLPRASRFCQIHFVGKWLDSAGN